MKKRITYFLYIIPTFFLFSQESKKNPLVHDWQIILEAEYRYFIDEGKFENQLNHFPSLSINPKYNVEWNGGKNFINFSGFFRLDRDKERTHFDIRELYYQKVIKKLELNIGFKKIFWGVTESNHLVDIINQTDQIESFDGEKKLGQPMVQFSYNTNLGVFDLFYMPYFRKRVFPGEKGRFRFSFVFDKNDIEFESKSNEWHQDFAFRWSHSFSIFDIGISHFYGTGREPVFDFNQTTNSIGIYPIINQTGIDVQITHNAFLWKVESINRTSTIQNMFAVTAGLEYTFGNIVNSGIDIGLLGEYLFDSRDEFALNALQNDFFLGSRIAFNDVQSTEILIGNIKDLTKTSNIFSIEASRRLGDSFKMELEARFFINISDQELILNNFENDSFFRISIFKYL